MGENGSILAGFHGQNPRLITKHGSKPLTVAQHEQPAQRYTPWLDACQGGDSSPGDFLNAATITDTVNLGTVALRAGKKVTFDSESMKITNSSQANRYLYREYREGWEL